MTPNWEAFNEAVGILVVATPFLFGVLTLFAVVIALLSRVNPPTQPR